MQINNEVKKPEPMIMSNKAIKIEKPAKRTRKITISDMPRETSYPKFDLKKVELMESPRVQVQSQNQLRTPAKPKIINVTSSKKNIVEHHKI